MSHTRKIYTLALAAIIGTGIFFAFNATGGEVTTTTLCPPPPTTLTTVHADPMNGDQYLEWGSLQAVSASRITLATTGADPRPSGNGAPSPTSYRKLSLNDGDNFYGERVEIGRNERRYGITGDLGTFMLYQPGQRYQTYFSLRLPTDFPITNTNWQIVMQMKQAQPYTNDGNSIPILAMQANNGTFQMLGRNSVQLWKAPATLGRWIRFHLDITYSKNPSIGRVRVQIDDRAGATDFVPQYDSGDIATQTLTYAVGAQSGSGWSLADGQEIPSHLRLGAYRNSVITGSTHIDISNVQVYK